MKERFYPFAEERGFHRGKASSMFTPFRRKRGHMVHVFDVQWDKYGAPRFVINFGEAPSNGIQVLGKHISADQLETYHCLIGRLQRRRGGSMGTWFQLRKPISEAIKTFQWNYRPEEVVDHVITSFSELETWWETKREGPHVPRLHPLRPNQRFQRTVLASLGPPLNRGVRRLKDRR
jgi:hypothetical protein